MDTLRDILAFLFRWFFLDFCAWLGSAVAKAITFGRIDLDAERGGEAVVATLLLAMLAAWMIG